ncbi:Rhodanese-like protein [Violaceomyces palustris]|uniref:Rhodanese-like protein n=1 Tax=Violaceomyces palustris TaxID=1673888 RepID=A0ACD0NMG9_9BASI|nr:Rhodanese-like protein [Violaceomyces palustris]
MSFTPPFKYIDADSLAEQLREQQKDSSSKEIAIVDVRDDDFVGGNIVGARNVPSTSFESQVDSLVLGPLKEFKKVVFHCSLSQQRGPKAARIYSETRTEVLRREKLSETESKSDPKGKPNPEQEVLVLRGGFSEFGAKFKNEKDIVEKYDEESWSYR